MPVPNPYNYNLPVTPEMFVGRDVDTDLLVRNLVTTPGDSVALIGGRRMGKTSLLEAVLRGLNSLEHNATCYPLPVFIDLTGEGIDAVARFFQIVVDQVSAILSERLRLTIAPIGLREEQPIVPILERTLVLCVRAQDIAKSFISKKAQDIAKSF